MLGNFQFENKGRFGFDPDVNNESYHPLLWHIKENKMSHIHDDVSLFCKPYLNVRQIFRKGERDYT